MKAAVALVYYNKLFNRTLTVAIVSVCIICNALAANEQSTNDFSGVIKGIITITDKEGNKLEDYSNVVVFVDGLSVQKSNIVEQSIPNLSHKGLKFTPRVLPIIKGSNVNFLNDDNIFHNVFSLSKAKTFDLGIYPAGSEKFLQFDQPGLVKVYCNIHPNMISNILVLNNSLFSKTDTYGNYLITNVPTGNFTLRVWYEQSSDIRREIKVQTRELLVENFDITKSKIIKKHKNKFGMPYREKY